MTPYLALPRTPSRNCPTVPARRPACTNRGALSCAAHSARYTYTNSLLRHALYHDPQLPDGAAPAPGLYYSPDGHHARFVEGTGAPGGCGPLLLVGGGSDHVSSRFLSSGLVRHALVCVLADPPLSLQPHILQGCRVNLTSLGSYSLHIQVVGQMRERYADKDPYASLEAWARGAFPDAGRAEQRWSSVVFRPAGAARARARAGVRAGAPPACDPEVALLDAPKHLFGLATVSSTFPHSQLTPAQTCWGCTA